MTNPMDQDPLLVLTVMSGPDTNQSWCLNSVGNYRLGRGSDCHLRLSDPTISRVQCEIVINEDGCRVVDLSSRWGTRVDGQWVNEQAINDGTVIELGDTQLRVKLNLPPPPETLPPKPYLARAEASQAQSESENYRPESSETAKAQPATSLIIELPQSSDCRTQNTEVDLHALVGETFLHYKVNAVVARAASGMVYRATDSRENQIVALKIFWPALFVDEKTSARFLRSMQAMLPLKHEHLVQLLAAGRSQNLCYTVNEYVEGESAAQLIARIGIAGMLDWRTTWKIGLGLSKALEYIHENHVLHRNLRPHNLLIRKSDACVKLGDTLLAKSLDHIGGEKVTQRGEIVGDLYYSSPEQVTGNVVIDQRSDLYSLGAVIYALLTGKPPFVGGPAEIINQILNVPPEPPTKTHLTIPASLEGVVLRLLAKHPDGRYTNATLVRRDLERAGKLEGLI